MSQLICFCCARSRTTEESYVTLYTEVLSVELTRDELCEKFRAWARSSVQGQCVELALSKRDKEASSSARMMYRMYIARRAICALLALGGRDVAHMMGMKYKSVACPCLPMEILTEGMVAVRMH